MPTKPRPRNTGGSDKKTSTNKYLYYVTAVAVVLFLGFVFAAVVIGGYQVGGEQQSHMEGMDYSDYATGLAIVTAIVIILMIVTGAASAATTGKTFAVFYVMFWICIVGLALDFAYGIAFGRAWADDAESDAIVLQNNAGTQQSALDLLCGNTSVLGAHIESYHNLDESQYDGWPLKKFITFDDRYRVILRLNNTAYWNSTGQNLTDVTARLKGYALPDQGETNYKAVTAWMSPVTQPGDVNYNNEYIVVFEDIDQKADESAPAYYIFEILNNDSTVLGRGYIHPRIELDRMAWFMNLKA